MTDFPERFSEAMSSDVTLVQAQSIDDSVAAFAASVVAGLSERPRRLDCRFLYDAEGSRLFEEITRQPEYYPTRTEAQILERYAGDIADTTGRVTLVELGSGYSVKTEHLLTAYAQHGLEVDYVPVDVSVSALREANRSIAERFPEVNFTGISGTYGSAFEVFRDLGPVMVVFLGSTIGNFDDAQYAAFWRSMARHLPVGGRCLLGADLVKDVETLEAAYNDAAGTTARFTVNLFARMNRELGCDIDLDQVEHVAVWNPETSRIETSARFLSAQEIHIESEDRTFSIEAGEQIHIEISRKFEPSALRDDLAGYGFAVRQVFTDDDGLYALLLLERTSA